MKPLILILAITATASAQSPGNRGNNGRGSYDYGHSSHSSNSYSVSDWSDNHTSDTLPHAVPEPSSPLVMLVSAGLALIGRRSRKPGRGRWVKEKRIDLRTVRFP
jgi:hypothetical protein